MFRQRQDQRDVYSEPMKIALIDDDANCKTILKNHLIRYGAENGQTFQIDSFDSGMEFLCGSCAYDAAFLDVQMPHLDGIETARAIRGKNSDICIVFVTNYAEYAIKGYEVRAFDYILKPVLYGNFCICMEKIFRAQYAKEKPTVMIEYDGELICLPASDIFYVESNLHYITYHTKNGTYRKRGKLDDVAEALSPYAFARASASYLVNLRYCEAVKENAVIIAGTALSISRSHKKAFREELTAFLGGTVL